MKKVLMYVANRLWLIALIYILSLFCSATLFSVFESKSLWDGLWWSIVTALTIGYGDLSPVTVPGRLTGIIFGHFWIFGIIPLIIGNVLMTMLEDKNKFTDAEQEWHEEVLRRIAKQLKIDVAEAPPSC